MRVDFVELRKIPLASVLHFYKVPVRKRSDTELVAQCPLPSHPQDSKHEWTLAISTEIGKAYCHNTRCREASNKPKGMDAIDFVGMMEHLTALDAGKRIAELFAVGAAQPSPSKLLNPSLAFELKNLDPAHPYIAEKGIRLKTAKDFGIGYHAGKGSMANRICFPLHEEGALIGYCGRTVLPVSEENPKWKMPKGLIKSFIYELERCDPYKPVSIVEGTWAVLHLAQNGIQAAALLGSSMTEAQEALLAPFEEIRICMDDDFAGREAAYKIAERLRKSHKVSKAFLKT